MEITFETLIDWLEGRLTGSQAAQVEQELTSADAENVAWLRSFLANSQEIQLESPPVELRAELLRRFATFYPQQPQQSIWQTMVATLTFDSRRQWAAAGLRSAATTAPQQLIFSTDAAEVALDIRQEEDDGLTLSGQLFLNSETAAGAFTAELLQESGQKELTTVDELGEFRFSAVSSGVYLLVLSSEDTEILLSPIELYAEAAEN